MIKRAVAGKKNIYVLLKNKWHCIERNDDFKISDKIGHNFHTIYINNIATNYDVNFIQKCPIVKKEIVIDDEKEYLKIIDLKKLSNYHIQITYNNNIVKNIDLLQWQKNNEFVIQQFNDLKIIGGCCVGIDNDNFICFDML